MCRLTKDFGSVETMRGNVKKWMPIKGNLFTHQSQRAAFEYWCEISYEMMRMRLQCHRWCDEWVIFLMKNWMQTATKKKKNNENYYSKMCTIDVDAQNMNNEAIESHCLWNVESEFMSCQQCTMCSCLRFVTSLILLLLCRLMTLFLLQLIHFIDIHLFL